MDVLVRLYWGFLLVVVSAIAVAPLLKYFSRGGLTFLQSLWILAVSFAVMTGIMLVFFFAVEPVTGGTVTGLASLLSSCLAGSLITRLAKNEGVQKTGWLGVGAKSILSLIGLSWIMIGVMYLAGAFSRI